MVSKSNALHFAGIGLKDTEHPDYTYPGVFVKFTEFSGNKEIESEVDEGHTGRRTLNLGEVRNKASASPEISDRFRLNQGLEDFCYHALGTMSETSVPASEKNSASFKQEITPNIASNLPEVHILHGFNDDTQGCRIYKNGVSSELSFTMNSEDAPTLKASYITDYPEFGDNSSVISPTFGAYLPKALKSGSLSVFFAPKSNVIDETNDRIDCLTDSEVTINNNTEASICAGVEFGESNKDIKNLEVSGSMTLRYAGKDIERLFATNEYNGVKVSEYSLEGALRWKYVAQYADPENNGKVIPLLFQIDIPNATITNAESSESGDDTKTISIEFNSSEDLANVADIIKITTQSAKQFKTGDNVTAHICTNAGA